MIVSISGKIASIYMRHIFFIPTKLVLLKLYVLMPSEQFITMTPTTIRQIETTGNEGK